MAQSASKQQLVQKVKLEQQLAEMRKSGIEKDKEIERLKKDNERNKAAAKTAGAKH